MNDVQSQLALVLLFLSRTILLLVVLFFLINIKKIWKSFKEIKNKTWIILFFIILVSFFLRFFWLPHEHLVIDDGFNDLNIAYTIQKHNVQAMCYFVSGDFCNNFFYTTFWPPGYHLTLSYVFDFFNPSQEIAFKFSAFLGTVSVFLAFLLGYLWSKKEDIALIGAFVFGLIPPLLKFSGAVSQNFFSLFVILFVFLFFEIFLKNKDKSIFFLFFFSLFFAVYSRPENIFLIPVFFFIFIIKKDLIEFIKNNKKIFISFIVASVLLIVPIFALIYLNSIFSPQEGWSPSIKETINYFLNHSVINAKFFVNPQINSLVFVIFAVMGILFSFIKERKKFLLFFLFFVTFFIIYACYDHGVFHKELIKNSLILYIPLLFFFIKGLSYFFDNIKEEFKKLTIFVFMLVFTINLIPTIPFIVFEKNQNISITHLLLSVNKKISDGAYIVSVNPSLPYSTIKKNSVSPHAFKNNHDYFKNKEVYLLIGHWWHPRLEQDLRWFEKFITDNYNLKEIEAILPRKKSFNNLNLGIYKLEKK